MRYLIFVLYFSCLFHYFLCFGRYGYLHCIFHTLCTLRNVHRGNFLLDFLHTYFVKHVFVDGSCHDTSVTERDAFSDEENSDEEDSDL